MKFVAFFLILVTAITSCNRSKFCSSKKNYLKKIDITKPFHIRGVYCISNIKDTTFPKGKCLVKVNMYDRVRGNKVNNGVIRFYGKDTVSLIIDESKQYTLINPGRYSISVWEVGYSETRTKPLDLVQNKKIEINFYLGTTVIY